MPKSDDVSARTVRITLKPGARPVLKNLRDAHTLVVTEGRVSLLAEHDLHPLAEGDVTTLQPGSYTVSNPCDHRTLRVLLLAQ